MILENKDVSCFNVIRDDLLVIGKIGETVGAC